MVPASASSLEDETDGTAGASSDMANFVFIASAISSAIISGIMVVATSSICISSADLTGMSVVTPADSESSWLEPLDGASSKITCSPALVTSVGDSTSLIMVSAAGADGAGGAEVDEISLSTGTGMSGTGTPCGLQLHSVFIRCINGQFYFVTSSFQSTRLMDKSKMCD